MDTYPEISICIPAYKSLKFINQTLQSIKNQTYTNWELIIVEDGIDDGTEQVVNAFKKCITQRVQYIKKQKNTGVSDTRNIAVSFSTGRWIAFIDSDDLWAQNHLSDLIETSVRYPNSRLIQSDVIVFANDPSQVLDSQSTSQDIINQLPVSLFDGRYPTQPSAMMIETALYKLLGGFDTTLKSSEDKDLWFRCARSGCEFAFTGKATSFYRKHNNALTICNVEISASMARMYSMHANWNEIPKKIRNRCSADSWLSAARLARANDKKSAKKYIAESMKYRKTFKQVCFWIIINTL